MTPENTVTISTDEYKKLLESTIRIDVFADYVNTNKYSITRKECGTFLGFEVKNESED